MFMISKQSRARVGSLIVCILLLTLMTPSLSAQDQTFHLKNGMKVILRENHASPMVASVIFVRSGSKYESQFENGITHLLEHLLFDGTVHKSRLEIDKGISDLGGYINAFTRKDLTAYLVLMPRQYIDYGLTTQADMLFNSVFPEEELAKERQVVIEEIRQSADRPGHAAEEFFTARAYAGTDYARPVIGYESFIEHIPREAIISYWKQNYRPGNMTALVIGDFESRSMKDMVTGIFGAVTDSLPQTSLKPEAIFDSPPSRPQERRYDTVANVHQTYIDFSFAAPPIQDSMWLAMDLLARYLDMESVSPLASALIEGQAPPASEVSISLVPYSGFSRLEISILTDQADRRNEIIDTTLAIIRRTPVMSVDTGLVSGIRTSILANDIYYSEKLHYYGFIIAPYMATAGWDFVADYAERMQTVTWPQARLVARKWLAQPSYVVTAVRPADSTTAPPYQPETPDEAEVKAHFDTISFTEVSVDPGSPLEYPETDSVRFEWSERAGFRREVLPNGLTVIIKSDSTSRVFAMNVLGKHRTLMEPEQKTGITDFVDHMLERGTKSRDAARLAADLARIGAQVTLYDNPWIPFDDRYTTRMFSFLKFETIEQYASQGLELFAEMIVNPAFDSSEIENVRMRLLGAIGRQSQNPRQAARSLFYATLFENSAFGRPIEGTRQTLSSITRDDLVEHHRRFYSPQNMIVTIVTTRTPDEVIEWVRSTLGQMPPVRGLETPEYAGPEPLLEGRVVHKELPSEQVAIYMGGRLPGADRPEAVPVQVATELLSNRLFRSLREKQGLAYSVGTGARFDREFGWYYNVISTGSDNYDHALNGLILETEKLKLDGPTYDELMGARNQIWGSLASARLSRINQAYYLGVNEYYGRKVGYTTEFLKLLQDVTVDDIRRVMARWFVTDAAVVASAGAK